MSQHVATKFAGAAIAPIIFPPSVPTPILLKCDRSATVSVRVSGTPVPRVSWHLQGSSKQQLLDSSGYHQSVEKEEHSLLIGCVTDDLDEGIEVRAVNSAGQDRFSIPIKTFRLLSSHTPSSSPGLEQRSLNRSSHLRRSVSDSSRKSKTLKHTNSKSCSRTDSRTVSRPHTPDDLLTWHEEMIQRTREIRSVDDLNFNDQSDEEDSTRDTNSSLPLADKSVNPVMTQSLSNPPILETVRQSRPVMRSFSIPQTHPSQRFLETDLDAVETQDVLPSISQRENFSSHSGKPFANQNSAVFTTNPQMTQEVIVHRKQFVSLGKGLNSTSKMRDSSDGKFVVSQGNSIKPLGKANSSGIYTEPTQVHRSSMDRNYLCNISRSDSQSNRFCETDAMVSFKPSTVDTQERFSASTADKQNNRIETMKKSAVPDQAVTEGSTPDPTDAVFESPSKHLQAIKRSAQYREVHWPDGSIVANRTEGDHDADDPVWTMFGFKLSEICCQLLSNFSFVADSKCNSIRYRPVPRDSELIAGDLNDKNSNNNNNSYSNLLYVWGKDLCSEYQAESVKEALQDDFNSTSGSNDLRKMNKVSSFHPTNRKVESPGYREERNAKSNNLKGVSNSFDSTSSNSTNSQSQHILRSNLEAETQRPIHSSEEKTKGKESMYHQSQQSASSFGVISQSNQSESSGQWSRPAVNVGQQLTDLANISVSAARLEDPGAQTVVCPEAEQVSINEGRPDTSYKQRPPVKLKPPISKKPSITAKDIRQSIVLKEAGTEDRSTDVKPTRPLSASVTGSKKPPVPAKPVFLTQVSSKKTVNSDQNLKHTSDISCEPEGQMSSIDDSDTGKRVILVESSSSERLTRKATKKPPRPPVESKGHVMVKRSSTGICDKTVIREKCSTVSSNESAEISIRKDSECGRILSNNGGTYYHRDSRCLSKNGSLSPPPVYRERNSQNESVRGMSGSRSVEHLSSINAGAEPRLRKRSLSREWKVTTVTTKEEITVVLPSSRQGSPALQKGDGLKIKHLPNSSQDCADKWNVITTAVGEMIGNLSEDTECLSETRITDLCHQSQSASHDPKGHSSKHDSRSHSSKHDPRSHSASDDPRSNLASDDPRGYYSKHDTRSHSVNNDPRNPSANDDVRSHSANDDSMSQQFDTYHADPSVTDIEISTGLNVPSSRCSHTSNAVCDVPLRHSSDPLDNASNLAQPGQYFCSSGNSDARFSGTATGSRSDENSKSSGTQYDELIDSLLVIASSSDCDTIV